MISLRMLSSARRILKPEHHTLQSAAQAALFALSNTQHAASCTWRTTGSLPWALQEGEHTVISWNQHLLQQPPLHQQHRGAATNSGTSSALQLTPALEQRLAALSAEYDKLQEDIAGETNAGSEHYKQLCQQAAGLHTLAEGYKQMQTLRKELAGVQEMAAHEADQELQQLAHEEATQLQQQISEAETSLLLGLLPEDSADDRNVVLEVRAGVGGDWAAMFAGELLDMYARYAANQGWRYELCELTQTDHGGCKLGIATVSGAGAYGALRTESGVHRAQAVPFNDSKGRMQTATATVAVLPEATEVEVHVNEADLRIDTYRASGSGGQHVNTTDSAVRVTHLPTGVIVACQNERSQHQNRAKALQLLRAKLYELECAKQAAALSSGRQAAMGTARFSERIRTYNYQEGRVTDHRTGATIHGGLADVLSGDRLGELVDALAHWRQETALSSLVQG